MKGSRNVSNLVRWSVSKNVVSVSAADSKRVRIGIYAFVVDCPLIEHMSQNSIKQMCMYDSP